jgi:mono/diheme cytochrome c family protein
MSGAPHSVPPGSTPQEERRPDDAPSRDGPAASSARPRRALRVAGLALAVLGVLWGLGAAAVWHLNVRGDADEGLRGAGATPGSATAPAAAAVDRAALIARGEYIARAGNCMACHSERGEAPWAGGRAIDTPFGTVYTSNLTPDPEHGLGRWTSGDFWRALHNGRSRDGRLLYPAFPYPNYTRVTREDSDALFAYLQSLPPVARANQPHALRWPYGTQPALAVWRALYFTPGVQPSQPSQSAEWNRGAYLVEGLGHCSACHTPRNSLGATDDRLTLSGALIPMKNWYAPSLTSSAEAGVADWDVAHISALLGTGVSARGVVTGPMAEVVLGSTQHLTSADLAAMATFLKALPQTAPVAQSVAPRPASQGGVGGRLYGQHCAQCHGEDGRGIANAYPPLAGNRAVTMRTTSNLVQTVLNGGYAPATAGNPRPYGMPPFALALSDAEVAQVLTYIRNAWGNQAPDVSELDVARFRGQSR